MFKNAVMNLNNKKEKINNFISTNQYDMIIDFFNSDFDEIVFVHFLSVIETLSLSEEEGKKIINMFDFFKQKINKSDLLSKNKHLLLSFLIKFSKIDNFILDDYKISEDNILKYAYEEVQKIYKKDKLYMANILGLNKSYHNKITYSKSMQCIEKNTLLILYVLYEDKNLENIEYLINYLGEIPNQKEILISKNLSLLDFDKLDRLYKFFKITDNVTINGVETDLLGSFILSKFEKSILLSMMKKEPIDSKEFLSNQIVQPYYHFLIDILNEKILELDSDSIKRKVLESILLDIQFDKKSNNKKLEI